MAVGTERVALVTGASSGIGKAAARALLGAGFTVYGTSRKAAAGDARGGVVFLPLDVTDDVSVAGAVREVLERSGRIDVLVNNAGIGSSGASEESSLAQDRIVFDVNVFGLIRMTKAVLPHMRAQESGRVINMSSVGGFAPQPFMASYVASKHAVEGYSESVDHEVREHGVRILLVEPFNTSTGFDASVVRVENPLPVYERGTADLRSHPGGGDEDRQRPRRDRQGDRRGGNRPKTKAAVHRRLGSRPRQHAPPPRPRPDLRQADPQDQPDDIVLTGRERHRGGTRVRPFSLQLVAWRGNHPSSTPHRRRSPSPGCSRRATTPPPSPAPNASPASKRTPQPT